MTEEVLSRGSNGEVNCDAEKLSSRGSVSLNVNSIVSLYIPCQSYTLYTLYLRGASAGMGKDPERVWVPAGEGQGIWTGALLSQISPLRV